MESLEILALICAILGIVGSIVPALPGPPLSWLGLMFIYFAESTGRNGDPMSGQFLLVWLVMVVLVSIIDFILPGKFTAMLGGHKEASTGATLGLFAGVFFSPIGMLGGALLGAFIGEMMVNKEGFAAALKAAIGAFIGFIATTGIKLICCCVLMYYIVDYIW